MMKAPKKNDCKLKYQCVSSKGSEELLAAQEKTRRLKTDSRRLNQEELS